MYCGAAPRALARSDRGTLPLADAPRGADGYVVGWLVTPITRSSALLFRQLALPLEIENDPRKHFADKLFARLIRRRELLLRTVHSITLLLIVVVGRPHRPFRPRNIRV